MQDLGALQSALANFLSPSVVLYLLLGAGIGFLVGILPGLGATVALALMLPFVLDLTAFEALAFMLSMVAVTGITGDFTSILFGIPGEATSAALVMDGYPLSKRGQAGRALAAALVSSALGAVVGASLLALALPVMRPLILALGTPELFMLAVAGASLVGVLSAGSPVKGILLAAVGFSLATIGADPKTGILRYTFDQTYLFDGVPLIPMTVGLFAIPELVELAINRSPIVRDAALEVKGVMSGVRDALRHWFLAVRCSLIAVVVGVIPGLGGGVSQWMAYGHALQSSRHPEEFGRGSIEGVIGPGAANNAKDGGALIPLVGFGIPGSLQGTVLLGALLILGLSPGPEMVREDADVTIFMIAVLLVTSLVATVALLPLLRPIARITHVDGVLLIPFIALFLYVASFSERRLLVDVAIMVVFGCIGWLMQRIGWSRPALLLGFVLAERAETSLWISSSIYGAGWLVRPGVVILGALALVVVIATAVRSRRPQPDSMPLRTDPGIRESTLDGGSPTRIDRVLESIATWAIASAFLGVVILAWEWPWAARLFPTVMAAAGLTCSTYVLVRIWTRSRDAGPAAEQSIATAPVSPDTTSMLRRGFGVLGWLILLTIAVQILGFVTAVPAFVFTFLVIDARKPLWVASGLALLSLVLFPGLFVGVLSIRFPAGLLF